MFLALRRISNIYLLTTIKAPQITLFLVLRSFPGVLGFAWSSPALGDPSQGRPCLALLSCSVLRVCAIHLHFLFLKIDLTPFMHFMLLSKRRSLFEIVLIQKKICWSGSKEYSRFWKGDSQTWTRAKRARTEIFDIFLVLDLLWNLKRWPLSPEVGSYKRQQESKKTRKHAFDQESDQEKKKKERKKERKHALGQEG